MNGHFWWYLARASGLVAWALLSASVIWGLLLSTRITQGRPRPAWLLDLHRFLAGAAVTFTALHLVGLVADSYVHFGVVQLLVPFASSWKPGAVALGVVALYLLVAVEATSLLMRHLPRRLWRAVHGTSFVLFWLATFHLLLAGTDSGNTLTRWLTNLVITTVVFLTLVRALSDRRPARTAVRPRIHQTDAVEPARGGEAPAVHPAGHPRPAPRIS